MPRGAHLYDGRALAEAISYLGWPGGFVFHCECLPETTSFRAVRSDLLAASKWWTLRCSTPKECKGTVAQHAEHLLGLHRRCVVLPEGSNDALLRRLHEPYAGVPVTIRPGGRGGSVRNTVYLACKTAPQCYPRLLIKMQDIVRSAELAAEAVCEP